MASACTALGLSGLLTAHADALPPPQAAVIQAVRRAEHTLDLLNTDVFPPEKAVSAADVRRLEALRREFREKAARRDWTAAGKAERQALTLITATYGFTHPEAAKMLLAGAETFVGETPGVSIYPTLARVLFILKNEGVDELFIEPVAQALFANDRAQATQEAPRLEGEALPSCASARCVIDYDLSRFADRASERGLAFRFAQLVAASAAGRAMAEASARAASGSGPLKQVVSALQAAQARARGLNQRLAEADARTPSAGEAVGLAREQNALKQELAQLTHRIGREFPSYVELVSPHPLTIAEAQSRLRPGEALLMVTPAAGGVVSMALGSTGELRVAWLKDRAASVTARVERLRCQLDPANCATEVPGPAAGYDREAAYSLYSELVAPVESALTGADRVFVVSSGALSGLPLQALLVAPSGGDLAAAPWLGDRYALITLPGVSNLRSVGRDDVSAPVAAVSFDGYGDPSLPAPTVSSGRTWGPIEVFSLASRGGKALANPAALRGALRLGPLPGTRVELRRLAEELKAPQGALHLGTAATETAVKVDAELPRANVVAFATHGLLPSEAGRDEPGLVLTPPGVPSETDDGVLTASEAAGLRLSADLVILSACNTASTDGVPGADSLSSLARAFLYAGARSLLASHWHVGDESTAALTLEVLRVRLAHPELGRAKALQEAERAIRTGRRKDGSAVAGYDPAWAHPSAWAPFVIIENQDR